MNILHLCTYHIGNLLYKNLFEKMDSKGISQSIYVPVRSGAHLNENLPNLSRGEIVYDNILGVVERFVWPYKILKQNYRVQKKIQSLESVDVIHAHTLFSDGGTAYFLSKKYDKPYHVAIRNTDINVFYKYGLPFREFSHKILRHASVVYFISESYRQKTLDILPEKVSTLVAQKSKVIPNAVSADWRGLDKLSKQRPSSTISLAFTGALDKNKNLDTVFLVLKKLLDEGQNVYLNVAGDGPRKKELFQNVHKMGLVNRVVFWGYLTPKELQAMLDQSHIFVLPSFKETFGISYIEAMSRGLPVIYTQSEGIDKMFPEGKVGYSTNPRDALQISDNICKILKNYEQISMNCQQEAKRFNWEEIADEYLKSYKS